VVLRDTNEKSVIDMMNALRIPIINAGNGTDEHPTQALADLYTIFKWQPALVSGENFKPVNLCIIGIPRIMRTVRSLLKLFVIFPEIIEKITIVSDQPEDKLFSKGQKQQLQEAGLNIETCGNPDDVLPEADVVYINAIAWEGESFQEYGMKYCINAQSPLKENAIIMHPLARGEELSSDLDDTEHNWYFAQARGAVFLRQALLTCLVRRAERVLDIV
jgi:aspartate carbamoyltransferase catalytic subunit